MTRVLGSPGSLSWGGPHWLHPDPGPTSESGEGQKGPRGPRLWLETGPRRLSCAGRAPETHNTRSCTHRTMAVAAAAQAAFPCAQPRGPCTRILPINSSHPGAGPSSSLGRVLPLRSVSNQLALALSFIRGLRKLGFFLEFIKAERSWACCPPAACAERAWGPRPHLVATTPCPSAGCLWALSQEAPRRKPGG